MDENEYVSDAHNARQPLELRCRVCGRKFTDDFVQYVPEQEGRWDLDDRVWGCIKWPQCPGQDADIVIIEGLADRTNDAHG